MTEAPVIRTRDVYKAFGRKLVLRGASLEIGHGETVVVLGGSGSGKSVFLKHLNGLIRPDAGEVEVFGRPVEDLDATELVTLRRRVAYIFQSGALFDSLTVAENVAFGLCERGDDDDVAIQTRVTELLTRVELPSAAELFPADLSGGMRKRVAIARGLALTPEVILYDEPTAGLDPVTGQAITRLISEVAAETGATSVVVTHDMLLARELGARVAFLLEGRFTFTGTLAEAAAEAGLIGEFVHAGGIDA
jgi:ABC-type transporter Mla maintaining outer membrane lipid asymmetry ATPase subunit MlaF